MAKFSKGKRERAPAHPGGILKRLYLEELHYSNLEFSKMLAAVSRKEVSAKTMLTKLSEVTNERRSMSPEFALLVSLALGTELEVWVRLQANYDAWHAEQEYYSLPERA